MTGEPWDERQSNVARAAALMVVERLHLGMMVERRKVEDSASISFLPACIFF